jgi:hypothetical protein
MGEHRNFLIGLFVVIVFAWLLVIYFAAGSNAPAAP